MLNKINATTWKEIVKSDLKDELNVVIGDDKQPDFKPQMKVERWSNEVNCSIRLVEDKDELKETPTIIEEDGKVKHIKSKREIHIYQLGISEEHPEGAGEFEVILKEKPKTNVIEFTLQTKGLEFFYQSEPRTLLKDGSWNCAENIPGSYAVYYKDCPANIVGQKEYKVGKAFHIYRPRIEDANGDWVWGDLNIDEKKGLMTVTIPQDFLDNAVYPVRHAAGATFGYTTAGASSTYNTRAGGMNGGTYTTSGQSGEVTDIRFSCSDANGNRGVKGGLYLSAAKPTLVTNGTSNQVITGSTSQQWITCTFGTNPSLSDSTIYVLTFSVTSGVDSGVVFYYDGTSTTYRYGTTTAGNTPMTDGPGDAGSGSRRYSVYVTYTAGGGGAVVPTNVINMIISNV